MRKNIVKKNFPKRNFVASIKLPQSGYVLIFNNGVSMQVNQSGISGTYAAQSGNIAATKNVEDSAQADKVDSYTVQADTVTISQAALDAAASDAETQGNGSGTEPPLAETEGNGSGTEPPLVGTDGNGSGTEPPLVETQGNGSGTEPPKAN